ncbi:hypothetical protein ACFZDK_34265 [Streptomyces sp. NPDC007901]|uniref:hypothetical protein n=1 Tax=Streptomyces sp. NPDC007901 TaxID=3364785 RepID=UPI0036E746DB
MPAIGHVYGVRGALTGAFRVGGGPVAADDLDTRMFGKPAGKGCGLAVGQQSIGLRVSMSIRTVP